MHGACDPTIATVGTGRDRTVGREGSGGTSTGRGARQDRAGGPSVPAGCESNWSGGDQTSGHGSEQAWPDWSFVTKAYAGAIDQQLSEDMTRAEISVAALNNGTTSLRTQVRRVQLFFLLNMLCTGKAFLGSHAPHGWRMEAWPDALPS